MQPCVISRTAAPAFALQIDDSRLFGLPWSDSQAVSLPRLPGMSKVVPRISSWLGGDGSVSGSSPQAASAQISVSAQT